MSLEFNLISSENYCTYITDGTHGTHSNQETGKYLLSAKDILDGNVHIKDNSRIISEEDFNKIHKNYKLENYDVLLTVAGTIGRTAIIKNYQNNYTFQRSVAIFKTNDKIKSLWLYYYLNSPIGKQIIKSLSKGTTQLILPLKDLRNLEIPVPKNISDQKKILSILTDIDKKIEINKRINQNLTKLIEVNFKNYLLNFDKYPEDELIGSEFGPIPIGWKVSNLTGISNYQNGLAMQKFPPEDSADCFKVLKIKELRQGFFDESSDLCSKNIKEECIVYDGDVIFSWSGSLLVDIWAGGTCGLNQHLFKVTSSRFDKWFYYCWTKFYLNQFILIAKDKATTMGHIKRQNLDESLVLIPNKKTYDNLTKLFQPLFKLLIKNKIEIKKLQILRDTLLPKLMSGEIDVSKINYDLKNMINNFNIISLNLFNKGINMKTKIISKIQNQMKPYLNQGQYIKLTNSLLNSLQDIDIIDNNNDLSEVDNLKLLKLFLSAKEVEGCSEKTILYYKSTIEKMLMKIKKQVYNINTDDLRKYLYDYKYGNKSSKTTIDNIRRIFSSFFAWLEEEDYIIKNPVRRIHRVKTGRVVKETLTDENLEVLRDNCEEIRDLAIVELLISTGIRVGELVRLNINDVDFYERECIVFGKGESERVVYFDARTKIHLIEYIQSRVDENPALFVSLNEPYNRLGISGVETRLRELGKKCNINKVHPHKFRRTMATNAIDKGMPIEQVQRLLGHLQIDTTMQYAMVNQSNVKLAHRKFIG